MKNKEFKKEFKVKIVSRYLKGESITKLRREIWPYYVVNNQRKNIYNWILKYGNNQKYIKLKIVQKPRVIYPINMEYNYAMRYLNGKNALKLAKEIWLKKNPYENKSYILQWKNACIDKGIIESKIKRKIKKRINYEEFTKEQLIKIIKKYKEFEKIKKNGKNKI